MENGKYTVFKLKEWLEITQYLHKRNAMHAELVDFDYSGFHISHLYDKSSRELLDRVRNTNDIIYRLQMEYFKNTGSTYKFKKNYF